MLYEVHVEIVLKPTVMDAQGTTIERALHKMGHANVGNVRIGKFVTMEIEAEHAAAAREVAEAMCTRAVGESDHRAIPCGCRRESERGMKFGVVIFPGSNCDADCHDAVAAVTGQEVRYVWHEETDIGDIDCIVLPGGFSYGDYLRCGAVARFSPVMGAVVKHAGGGKYRHRHLQRLPGAHRSRIAARRAVPQRASAIHLQTAAPARGARRPALHAFLYAAAGGRVPHRTRRRMLFRRCGDAGAPGRAGQVIFRYCTPEGEVTPAANPNGSLHNIAGICNREGNVLGLMPHPERRCDRLIGGTDGKKLFKALVERMHLQSIRSGR